MVKNGDFSQIRRTIRVNDTGVVIAGVTGRHRISALPSRHYLLFVRRVEQNWGSSATNVTEMKVCIKTRHITKKKERNKDWGGGGS
jgi:hypothetical protein